MARIEKTVFICYRRTNIPWALAIFQYLNARGYDVFFDFANINSGDFEKIIIDNIKARAHFIVILTPSALKRCKNPGDWLRREIETALDTQRNIVPLMLEGFDFGSPSIAKYLTAKLAGLKRYNALNVPADYFDEAMGRLCTRYLSVPLDAVLHPVSSTAREAVKEQQAAATGAAQVETRQLTAQEWFEKGLKSNSNSTEGIRCFTEAIRLDPGFALAYYNRAVSRGNRGDVDGELKDYNEAIRLRPDDAKTYTNRGAVRARRGDLDGALHDFTEAIHLKPDDEMAYNNRGNVYKTKGNLDSALKDYAQAIRVKPSYANAYYNRALVWEEKGDEYAAIADYQDCMKPGGGSHKKVAEEALQRLKKKLGR